MELKPLTLEQAAEIADDFEDLIGSCIQGFDSPEITHVVVGPFNREQFPDFLQNNVFANELAYENPENEYDVLVIAVNNSELEAVEYIRDYISSRGIRYNFPE